MIIGKLNKDGTVNITNTAVLEKKLRPGQKLNEFLKGEISGTPKQGGILGDIFQKTVGSKGLLGVVQMPGQIAKRVIVTKAQNIITKADTELSKITTKMVQQWKKLPPGDIKNRNAKIIQDNLNILQQHGVDIDELEKGVLTPKEAIATGARAALTIAPYGKIAKGAQTALGITGAGLAPAIGRVGLQAGISGLGGAAFGAAQGLEEDKSTQEIGKMALNYGVSAAVIGGSIQLGSEAIRALGAAMVKIGTKIQTNVMSPKKVDIEDGFTIKNVQKYKLGGNLKESLEKGERQLTELNDDLRSVLGKSKETINTSEMISNLDNELTKEMAQGKYFGQTAGIRKILNELPDEIDAIVGRKSLLGGGIPTTHIPIPEAGGYLQGLEKEAGLELNLLQANTLKRAAGTSGAWLYGRMDPDASAKEIVYTTLYRVLRKSIEKAAKTPEVAAINNQMSEIIPIMHAIIRRIPVAERGAVLGLTEGVSLIGAVFNPKVLAITGLKLLSKSGQVGAGLVNLGTHLGQTQLPAGLPSIMGGDILQQLKQRSQ